MVPWSVNLPAPTAAGKQDRRSWSVGDEIFFKHPVVKNNGSRYKMLEGHCELGSRRKWLQTATLHFPIWLFWTCCGGGNR